MPLAAQGRADTDITAETADFWALGLDANDHRTDYGVSATPAAGGKHAKNSKFRLLASPASSIALVGGESLSLLSVSSNADGALLGHKMGGTKQTIRLVISGQLVGDLPDAP
jgi:hypothetical protein